MNAWYILNTNHCYKYDKWDEGTVIERVNYSSALVIVPVLLGL
jgi:hypothetical protein